MPRAENPWNDILNVQRWRKSGDLSQLRRRLWRVLLAFECGLNEAMAEGNGEDVRRWGHALNQVAGTYLKVTLDGDIEQRLKALEERATYAGS